MKNLMFTVLSLCLAIGLSADLAHARGQGKGRQRGGFKNIMKQLDLTDEQRTKLKEMRQGSKGDMKALRQKGKDLREKMKSQLKADASDADLKKTHQEIQSLRSQMADSRFNKMLQIRSILTPEQRKKFAELKGEMRERRGKRHRGGEGDDEGDFEE